MEYWVCENHAPGQGEVCVSLWDSKENAQQAACADIMMAVSNWDMNSGDTLSIAQEIDAFARNCNYSEVIKSYNEYQANSDDYEYVDYFAVYQRQVLTHPDVPQLMVFDPPDEDEEIAEEDTDDYAAKYNQPVTSGSTCRGPCGSYNEYADSDRNDGTHLCHQCKMMSNIFGG